MFRFDILKKIKNWDYALVPDAVPENNRILSIDILRFFAIFLVTGFHIARYFSYDLHDILQVFLQAFKIGGGMGCALFFVIAGYCAELSYTKGKNTYFSFWKKKIKKIIVSYYVAILFWIIAVKSGIAVKSIDFWDILTHCTFTHNLFSSTMYSISGVFWFLGTLVDFYILFPFITGITKKHPRVSFLSSIIICVFAMILENVLGQPVNLHRSIFIYLPCFVAGMLLFNKRLFMRRGNLLLILISLSTIFFIEPGYVNKIFFNLPLYYVCISILLSVGVTNLEVNLNRGLQSTNWISYIAQRSFSIYLYNYIFCAVKPVNHSSFVFIVLYIFTFCFGFLMYDFIEKKAIRLKGIKFHT
ncbi:MAG: acyltransferase [Alphaproteobacteria bacterium]|nr:acyltransferase [Alphaproteobacteria bacterium]